MKHWIIFLAIASSMQVQARSTVAHSRSDSRTFASCKATTEKNPMLFEDPKQMQASTIYAQKVTLTEDIKDGNDILVAQVEALDDKGKKIYRTYDAQKYNNIDADFNEYSYDPKSKEQAIKSLRFQVEFFEKDANGLPIKVLLSTFAMMRSSDHRDRFFNSRYICDYVNPVSK